MQIKAPESRHFYLRNVPRGVKLAPGKEIAFELVFVGVQAGSTQDYSDSIIVNTEVSS